MSMQGRQLHPFDDEPDVVSPAAPGAAPPRVLFAQQPGDTAAVSVGDLHQGQLGDCFLIAAMGDLAMTRPDAIASMIRANANGTETVTLYEGTNGGAVGRMPTPWTTAFRPVQVTVTNVFPSASVNNGASQDVAGGQKEIWAQVLEKAVATLDGGYGAIAFGGNPTTAMEELTGRPATFMSAAGVTQPELAAWSAAGDLVTFDTSAGSRAYNLVAGHAYMFGGLTQVNGSAAVQLLNPWGFDQPSAVPLSQLGRAFAEVDIGRVA